MVVWPEKNIIDSHRPPFWKKIIVPCFRLRSIIIALGLKLCSNADTWDQPSQARWKFLVKNENLK